VVDVEVTVWAITKMAKMVKMAKTAKTAKTENNGRITLANNITIMRSVLVIITKPYLKLNSSKAISTRKQKLHSQPQFVLNGS
jgi:hypothetical protein